jgi:hypothetical protein
LHPARLTGRLFGVPEGRVIEREEVTAMHFMIADLNVHTARIKILLEEYLDGEEEVPEDDA